MPGAAQCLPGARSATQNYGVFCLCEVGFGSAHCYWLVINTISFNAHGVLVEISFLLFISLKLRTQLKSLHVLLLFSGI